MRVARIKEAGAAYYHILSRVVDRRMVLDQDEKERFRTLLRAVETFSGCEVLTWACLDNHWHVCLHVPERRDVPDEEFVARLGHLYDRQEVKVIAGYLKELRQAGHHPTAEQLKGRYTCRMYDLSEFAKTLKQRFTQSFNKRHGRKGTLWEERFKSVLLDGCEGALAAVGAYIDLNAVRAGIVRDPKEYRFCGYGEALGGSRAARRGLGKLLGRPQPESAWPETAREYRKLLYVTGEARGVSETGQPVRPGFRAETVEAVLNTNGALPLNELLRCRVRYFTDGAVLGSRAFVEDVFRRHRDQFGTRRTCGAHVMVGGDWGGLCTLRRLRLDVISPAAVAG